MGADKNKPSPGPPDTLRMEAGAIRERVAEAQRCGALVVIAGTLADIGKSAIVEQRVSIGRSVEGLQLHDGNISWRHAVVERTAHGYRLCDLGSTNGTLLNASRIDGEAPLHSGDRIGLGQTVLKFEVVDETEASFQRHVDQLVGTDELTGMPSKPRFDAALEQAVRQAQTAQTPLSAWMMDLDTLKAINDAHGHHAGAATISRVGALIDAHVRQWGGAACRFGGDEFCVFVPGVALDQTLVHAESLRRAVAALELSLPSAETTLRTTISIGVATLAVGEDGLALLRRADQALYRAKAAGRDCVRS
ncbi:MAG: GGDEF domain-containing protein [Deltaproteobacteria bacterium]|nr:GGDEF domain-containing protein [Deltaproteobacteria bacterium]